MLLEPVIGLEIHVALKTKSKMFCACPNVSFADVEPNSSICPICLGYPGTLPVPNQTAIAMTQRAGAALNCHLATHSKFDRKHYFYPDLPKGYQISQYDEPFCGEGVFEIIVDGRTRAVGIERIHLEEDAAKNMHPTSPRQRAGLRGAGPSYTLVDFNRAGTPLIEIVTKPDLRSPAEAKVFLQELQKIMRTVGISDADMEKGQMRCDANISLRPASAPAFGGATAGKRARELYPKTEIKNVNSFKFVAKALLYEIERQTKLWAAGTPPTEQSTRGYDAQKNVTYAQRTKEAAADYRYFPDPDIPPFQFTDQELDAIKKSIPELPLAKQARLMDQLGVSDEQALLLLANPELADFYENTVSELLQLDMGALKQLAANIVLRQVRSLWQKTPGAPQTPGVDGETPGVKTSRITPANFAELIVLVYQGKINQDAIIPVLQDMQRTGGDPDHIIANLGLAQMGGGEELAKIIEEVVHENPDVVAKIKSGKANAIQALVGQVMKKTQGKAKASEVMRLLQERLG